MLIPEACVNCKYFALQPTGTSCSGFITIKVDSKVISKKQKRPKNCPVPLKESKNCIVKKYPFEGYF